jgi:hypothetical protein
MPSIVLAVSLIASITGCRGRGVRLHSSSADLAADVGVGGVPAATALPSPVRGDAQMSIYNVLDYGAVGDNETNDAPAIQQAIDACTAAGGGRVLVPAGRTYLCGQITLKANVDFHVEPGAVVLQSGDRSWFPDTRGRRRYFIGAEGAPSVSFTGHGRIDGNGLLYMAEEQEYIYVAGRGRLHMFYLTGCNNLTFRDITISNAAMWTVRIAGCDGVVFNGVSILNDQKVPNNDGIDIDSCRNVRISDCHIIAGDDAIVLKAMPGIAQEFGACENIVVSNCTLSSTSSALIIGCEAHAPIRNVTFDNCVVSSSHRGLAIHLSQGCDVENVLFSNMIVETRMFYPKWWGRGEPIYVTAIPWTKDDTVGAVRHVRFANVLCHSENGVFIYGWQPDRIEDLVLENVRVEIDHWSRWPAGQHDIRPYPQDEGGSGPVGSGVYDYPTAGFFLKNATGVTVRNCEVVWNEANRQEQWRHALESHGVIDLRLENFRGESARPDKYDALVQE